MDINIIHWKETKELERLIECEKERMRRKEKKQKYDSSDCQNSGISSF
jgi:hypothetical protein